MPRSIPKNPAKMPFVQHDHVVEALSANAADNAFTIRILPGRAWGSRDFFYSHALDTLGEVVVVDLIAIANEKTRCFLVWEGVDDLLGCPFSVGIRGNVKVNDLAPIVTQYDEDVQDTESHRRNREEVARRDVRNVVVEEGSPGLRWWLPAPNHVVGYAPFRHIVAQQGQFGYDPWRAPGRILA